MTYALTHLSWASLARELAEPGAGSNPRADLLLRLGQQLALAPASISPADDPRGTLALEAFEHEVWSPPNDPPVVSARQHVSRDQFVESELRRMRALLALAETERRTTQTGASTSDVLGLERRAWIVRQWVDEVVRRSRDPGEAYFVTHRLRDRSTYPPGDDRSWDPFVREVELILYQPRSEPSRLRAVFLAAGDDARASSSLRWREWLETLGNWMTTRYEFSAARRLELALHAHRAGLARLAGLRTLWLPRLAGTVVIGHVAILSANELSKWVDALASGPRSAPLAFVVGTASLAALFSMEIAKRSPFSRGRRLRGVAWLLALGALYAVPSAWGVLRLANAIEAPPYESPGSYSGSIGPILVFGEALGALLLGYLLQFLWDDEPITGKL